MQKVPKHARRGRRQPYHHGDLRVALVDSAAQVAAERGVTALTLRETARRAGVSEAAPYHYFPDKSALIAAVAEEGFRRFDASQASAAAGAGDDPVDRLVALGASYIRFALDRPHYFRVMFRPHLVEHAKYPSLNEVASRAFDRLVETVRAARLSRGHDDPDPVLAATMIWGVPHGLAALYLDGPTAAWTTPRALEDIMQAATMSLLDARLEDTHDSAWGV